MDTVARSTHKRPSSFRSPIPEYNILWWKSDYRWGKTWTDDDDFPWIQFDSADSNILYQLDPNQRPILIKKMTIASEKPNLYMAGFGPTFLNWDILHYFKFMHMQKIPIRTIRSPASNCFTTVNPWGDRLSDESSPESGLFYKLYDITPSASGTFNLQLRAKDRFGLLSDPWPRVVVGED